MEDFPVYDEKIAKRIAERAYEVYCEGNGLTEYESVQQAYDEAYAEKIVICNIEWDCDEDCDEDKNDIFGLPEEEEVPSTFTDEQITEYLSNEYGFCVKGYTVRR